MGGEFQRTKPEPTEPTDEEVARVAEIGKQEAQRLRAERERNAEQSDEMPGDSCEFDPLGEC